MNVSLTGGFWRIMAVDRVQANFLMLTNIGIKNIIKYKTKKKNLEKRRMLYGTVIDCRALL